MESDETISEAELKKIASRVWIGGVPRDYPENIHESMPHYIQAVMLRGKGTPSNEAFMCNICDDF